MDIKKNSLISISDVNKNFTKASHIVDEEGIAVVLKNNKPKFVIIDFDHYEQLYNELEEKRNKLIDELADKVIDENMEAFLELAK